MEAYKYNNEPEAQKIKHLLEVQDIPCEIHSFENWGYDGVFRGQVGMGQIVVPDNMADRAKQVIDRFIKEEREGGEGDPELKRLKLKYHVEQLKTLKFVINAALIIAVIAFFKLGFFGIILIGLLAIGVIFGNDYVTKELKRVKEKTDKI